MSVQGINIPYLNRTTVISTGLVPSNVVLVQSLSDLPTPVSSNITLSPNKIYLFAGIVDIGSNILTLDESTVLQGTAFRVDGFRSNATGNIVNSNSKSCVLYNLMATTPSGNLFNIVANNTNRVTIDNVQISGCSGIGKISGIGAFSFSNNRITSNGDGVHFYGPGNYGRITSNRTTNGTTNAYTGISFSRSGGYYNSLQIDNNVVELFGSGQTALYLESGITQTGMLANNLLAGAGSLLSGGLIKSDTSWIFNTNIGLTNSVFIGSLGLSGNTTATPIAASNLFVNVSGFSRTGQLMERFIMSNSGVLQYIGREPFNGLATFNGYFSSASSSNITWALGFVKNNVVIGDAYFEAFTTVTGQPTPVALVTTMTMTSGDTLAVAITNRTSTIAPTMISYNFVMR